MWAGGNQWGHWPMDAAAYQNMNHEQVDWATLAQQWIRMKEVHETAIVGLPMVPIHMQIPAQHIQPPMQQQQQPQPNHAYFMSEAHTDKGEAPMEVDKDEPEYAEATGNQFQWNQNNWAPTPPANFGYPAHPVQPFPHPGYYTGGPSVPRPPMPVPAAKPTMTGEPDDTSPFAAFAQGLDAAKRKQLPAWIREGLEKMERDKQKKEEREKMLEERELRRQQALKDAENGGVARDVTKSRFDDSGSESEADEPEVVEPAVKSPSPLPGARIRTAEEILQEAMLRIRRLMTEILLDVTTEEVRAVATEEYQRAVGLDYGSDSDGEDDAADQDAVGRPSKSSAEDSDSEDNLDQTIVDKQRQYALGQLERDRQAREAERAFSCWERRVRGDESEEHGDEQEVSAAQQVVTTKVEMESGNVTLDPGQEAGSTPEVNGGDAAAQVEVKDPAEVKEKRDENRGRSGSIETTSSRSKAGEKSRERRRTSLRARRSSSSEASRRSERKKSRDRSSRRSRSRDRTSRRSRSRDRDRRRSRSRNRNRRRSRSRDQDRKRSKSPEGRSRRSRSRDQDRKRSKSPGRRDRRSRSRDNRKRSRSRERRRDRSRSRDRERGRRSGSRERRRSRSREKHR